MNSTKYTDDSHFHSKLLDTVQFRY